MATANEKLQDAAIAHGIDLHRYSEGVVQKIIAVLNRSDRRLFAELTQVLADIDPSTFKAERLESLLFSVRSINKAAYEDAGRVLTAELQDFSGYEASFQAQALTSALPVGVHVSAVAGEQVYAAAMARPFQGALLKGWMADQEADKAKRIRLAVAQGVVEGRTTDQIVRDLRGTKAKGFQDGILEISRRNAAAVVRTAVGHVAGVAQDNTVKANEDVIKAVRWVSTLDSRTSPVCRARDGKQYTPVDHKPIDHALAWLGGPGRAHWCCRSAQAFVTKSWQELIGKDLPEFTPAQRASMDGQVPADTTYGQWLKKQPGSLQDEILGKDKGALFRTGKLPIEKFVGRAGNELTLEQLKAANPAAYARAGLDNPIRPPRGMPQDEIAKFLASPPAQQDLLRKLHTQGESYPVAVGKVAAVREAQGYTSSVESLTAARYYTGPGYAPINQRMRDSGGTLEDRQFTALTASGFKGIGEYTGEAWRAPTTKLANADQWWSRASEGQDLDLGNQLLSFSASREFAAKWARNGDVLLRLAEPRGGVYIDPLSQHQGEQEVLFAPGQTYRVVGKSTKTVAGKVFRVIDLEVGNGK